MGNAPRIHLHPHYINGQAPASPQNLSTAANGPFALTSTTDKRPTFKPALTWETRLNDAISVVNKTKAMAVASAIFIYFYLRNIV